MIFWVIVLQIAYSTAQQLKFVNVVYRHGDRTPLVMPYPTDPYPASIWEEGLEHLTDLGKLQMYDLGRYIRSRYPGFNFYEFNESDLYVQSSDVSRTQMSAQYLLAGMYSSDEDDIWSSMAKVKNIPIHTLPKADDHIILNNASCPKLEKLETSVIENDLSISLQEKSKRMLRDLSKFTGLKLDYSLYGLNETGYIFDTLSIEEQHGFLSPDWTMKFFPEPIMEIGHFYLFTLPYYTKEIKRLQCGFILKDIIKHFDDVANGKSKLKMWQYSGHDTTITDVLNCLNVSDNLRPPVASAVFLELYQDGNKHFNVKIVYKREGVIDKVLQIPGCSKCCPLDRLKELVKDLIPDDWQAECHSENF